MESRGILEAQNIMNPGHNFPYVLHVSIVFLMCPNLPELRA